jgi:hypothetical protein
MATAVGLFTLGMTTVGWLWRGGWIAPERLRLRLALALNLGFVALTALARVVTAAHWNPVADVLGLAVLEVVLLALYWFALRRFHPELVADIEQRFLKKVSA